MKSLQFYMKDCLKNGYCLGAFNFNNLETLKGICEGCKKSNSPAILCVSEGALDYIGDKFVKSLFDCAKKEYKLPLFLHLDHGKSFEVCKKAINIGFDSVMIDGSSLSFEENIKLTKRVVALAHKHNVLVEAELGVLSGIEDNISAEENVFTDPKKAKEFVEKTGCDSLAVAIGTSHGAYKFKGLQQLRFDILKKIENEIPNTPLVLHGASSVPQGFVKEINQFGGNLKGAVGIPEKFLAEAAQKHHIFKINFDTDIRLAFMASYRKSLSEKPENIDIRKPNLLAIENTANMIAEKNIKVFKNKGKI